MSRAKVSAVLLLTALMVMSVLVIGYPPEPPVRMGAWVDEIIVTEVVDEATGITMLEVGDLHIFQGRIAVPELFRKVQEYPYLTYDQHFGGRADIRFNPVGPIFPGTGELNPFSVPRIRQAMNWLVCRTHIAEVIYGGLAIPQYTAIITAFPDQARLASTMAAIRAYYAHNPEKAERIITEEMYKLGAERIDGTWHWEVDGVLKPVEIRLLIMPAPLLRVGHYIAELLEGIGFVTVKMEKTWAEGAPIRVTCPGEGRLHLMTGAWRTGSIHRDQAGTFNFHYTPRGWARPRWAAMTPAPEFDALVERLALRDFECMEERNELMARALWLSLEDNVTMWLVNEAAPVAFRKEIGISSCLAGGMAMSLLWPHTIQFKEDGVPVVGGTVRMAHTIVLPDPWNPLGGSTMIACHTIYRAIGDMGTLIDPFTGLRLPQRIERAEVFVKEGLPVTVTHDDWITLEFLPEIKVPDDAWVAWCAVEQRFITAAERPLEADQEPARVRVVIHYPDDLFDTVKWHDGSPFSIADIVMNMILTFDQGNEESPIFDRGRAGALRTLMRHFRGVRILSEDPLVIESFTTRISLDAETLAGVWTWFPYYRRGPAAWHNLTLGILAETDEQLAFSPAKAGELDVEWMNFVAGPSLLILADQLARALDENIIPYEPTLGQFITVAEATERWENLQTWYEERGHFFIGTGTFYLVGVHPVEKIIHLRRFPYFPDPAEKWAGFAEARVAHAKISGPMIVTSGTEAEFLVEITFEGEPYPVEDVCTVHFLVVDAAGVVAVKGEAVAVRDGLWEVVLTPEKTEMLAIGAASLEIVVAPRVVALSTSASMSFAVLPE